MTLGKKILHMSVFIEFLTGAGLALFFHWVLHIPEAAYSIFAIAILLSLATYLLREDLEKTRAELTHLYHQAHEIVFALAQITEPECQHKADELLAGTKRTISLLQQGFIPLDETEFYLEGAKQTDHAVQHLKTVDPMTPGWLSRGALVNLYQSNLRALERGVAITRVFVMNRDDLGNPDAQKILHLQYSGGVEVKVAFRDELPTASDISGRDTNSSFDFAIYDDQMVTDVFPQSGKFYGRKTSINRETERYRHLFEIIEHNSHAIALEDERVVLTSKTPRAAV